MKTRMQRGFSLVEMMVVLLITAVVMAATAPMISKKMVRDGGSSSSPWLWLGNSGATAYNIGGRDVSAIIGANSVDSGTPRLFIQGSGTVAPLRISDGTSGFNLRSINGTTISLTDVALADTINQAVAIGYSSEVENNAVAVGQFAGASDGAVAVGRNATCEYARGIAIGHFALSSGTDPDAAREGSSGGTAVGPSAQATGRRSVALGGGSGMGLQELPLGGVVWGKPYKTLASGINAIAIGTSTESSGTDTIVIGTEASADEGGGIAIGSSSSVTAGDSTNDHIGMIAVGVGAKATKPDAVAIGRDAHAYADYSTSVGHNAETRSGGAVALGFGAYAEDSHTVAIGQETEAGKTTAGVAGGNAIAIGYQAHANAENAVAIGAGAQTTTANQIMLGAAGANAATVGAQTVYIPGNLIVDGNVTLSRLAGNVTMRAGLSPRTHTAVSYGTINSDASGLYLRSSDRRLKNVGETFKGGLEELRKLEVFHYTYKKDPDKIKHVGVIAQDLQKIFPDAVIKGEDGFLRIRLEDMFYALLNAVKELDKRVAYNTQRITDLENQNADLTKTVAEQKEQIAEQKEQIARLEKRFEELEKKVK